LGITALSTTAVERMAGCTFSEGFYSDAYIEENGGTLEPVAGTPPTADSYESLTLTRTDSQYVSYPLVDELNHSTLTIIAEFSPTFDTDADAYYYLFSASGGTYVVNKADNAGSNTLRIRLGGTNIILIPEATYSPYWNVNSRNVLAISSTTGDTDVWLNGNKIVDADNTAWSPNAVSGLWLGSYSTPGNYFDGTLYKFQIYDSRLSDDDLEHLRLGTLTDYRDSVTVDLDCSVASHRAGTLQARDISGNDNHAKLGNSLVAAQAPTKTAGRAGYTFDGSDDYLSGVTAPTGAFTITVLERTGGAPVLNQDNDLASKWDDIMSPGQYSNELLTLRVHPTALTAMQLLDEQYTLFRRLNDNDLTDGVVLDLDAEGALDFYLDSRSGALADWSRNESAVSAANVTWDDTNFQWTSGTNSYVNNTVGKRSKGAWYVAGNFYLVSTNGTLLSQWETAGDQQYLWDWNAAGGTVGLTGNGARATATTTISNGDAWVAHAVNFESGLTPKGFKNGESIGDYSAAVTEAGDTVVSVIGNDHDYNAALANAEFTVAVMVSRQLSENEHRNLHSWTFPNRWETDAVTRTTADVEDYIDNKDPSRVVGLNLRRGSDGLVPDLSAYNHYASPGGDESFTRGRLGLQVNQSGGGSLPVFSLTQNVASIAFWIKQDASVDETLFVTTGVASNPEIAIVSDTLTALNFPNTVAFYVDGEAGTAITPGVWHHVVASCGTIFDPSAFNLGFGTTYGSYNGSFAGAQFFRRAISAEEAATMYGRGNAAKFETSWGAQETFGTVSSGNIGNTPFVVSSGVWALDSETVDDFLIKTLACSTAGKVYLPTTALIEDTTDAAFGQWEFSMYKTQTANVATVYFVGSSTVPAAGYYLQHDASDEVSLGEVGVGAATTPVSTTAAAWHDYKITRTSTGVFEVFIDDTSAGTFTDTTTLASSYIVFDFDAGDKIKYADFFGGSNFVKRLKHEL